MIWVALGLAAFAFIGLWQQDSQITKLQKELDDLKWDLINQNTIKPPQRK